MRAALLALFVAAVASADEPPAVTAARQRQEALPTVEFHLRVKSEKDSATVRLVFDGPKPGLDHRITSPMPRTWRVATDGERVRAYLLWDDPAHGGSAGNITPASEGVCRDPRYLPLTLAARPLDPVHCPFPIDTFTPAGTADVNGRTCDEFTGTLPGYGLPATAWFDPAAGHSLRRFRHGTTVTDVESSNSNPAGVWLPTKYTVTKADGTVVRECVVERVEVGKAYPAAEFDPPWPAGLTVHDLISGKEFVSDENGVLQSADPMQKVWDGAARLWWVAALAVVLPVGLIAWRVWRRRK